LQRILSDYASARSEPFAAHELGNFIRSEVPETITSVLDELSDRFTVKASCGQAAWADVPWIAIMEKLVTNSTQTGYYIVYLFAKDMSCCYLCLGQGVTSVEKEFGARKRPDVLAQRAALIRNRIPAFTNNFSSDAVELFGTTSLSKKYEEAPAFQKQYMTDDLPDDAELRADLRVMVELYLDLIYSGGVNFVDQEEDEIDIVSKLELEEKKRFKEHRRIEGRIDSRKVKRELGFTCFSCNFNYFEAYGELGEGYIEAHHLQPYSELDPGSKRKLNIKKDFAVLCANCHRMIHRMSDVSDIAGLRNLLESQKK